MHTTEMANQVNLDKNLTSTERNKKLEDMKVSNFWFNKGAVS